MPTANVRLPIRAGDDFRAFLRQPQVRIDYLYAEAGIDNDFLSKIRNGEEWPGAIPEEYHEGLDQFVAVASCDAKIAAEGQSKNPPLPNAREAVTKAPTDSEPLSLSHCAGPTVSTKLEGWSTSFDDLRDRLCRNPPVGTKDGSYWVRGPLVDGHDTRADEHIARAEVLVLDGDSSVDFQTGEIIEGAPHPMLVHEVLFDHDITHLIYTSHSHQNGKGNRYRVVIPAAIPDKEALRACVDWVITLLHTAAVPLCSVDENYRWSQPWFFPRKRSDDAEFLGYHHDGGQVFDVPACLDWNREETEREMARTAASRTPRPQAGVFADFDRKHGFPDAIAAKLTKTATSSSPTKLG